jgi:hypothetical protein
VTLAAGFKIQWTIHVANRKAAFFSFNGQSGARTKTQAPYVGRERPARAPEETEKEKKGRGQPLVTNRRNANLTDRQNLQIDPGPITISSPGSLDLIDPTTAAPLNFLGEVRMEPDGHLLVMPAFGKSASLPGAGPIEEYANNDGWFDDMCDGPISAVVTFPDGHTEQAEPAWVITGPPDFGPGIGNVVTLYDTLHDLAVRLGLPCDPGNDLVLQDLVRQRQTWRNDTNDFSPDYEPSFTAHIYPILSRALAAFDVFDVRESGRPSFHGTLWDWPRLSSHAESKIRQAVFNRMRDPNSEQLNRTGMPRGLGDDFKTLDDFEEDQEKNPQPSAHAFLSLTRVQYALLKAWAGGTFKEDWSHGKVKYAPVPDPEQITPHGMTIAALENCVGGPFYPGIEVSWLIRELDLYSSAFRLKAPPFPVGALTFGPGFFSQQMALPWHADFYDCHREEHTPTGADELQYYMWWTAQRPDFVRNGETIRRWVAPFDANKEPEWEDPDDIRNLARFEQMRTRWSELPFLVLEGANFVEQQ